MMVINMKNTDLKVLEVAKYLIENKATIQKVADHFEVSISTIKKYINEKLPFIDKEVYNAVKKVQNEIIQDGVIKGGEIGKRDPHYTDFEIMEIAEVMLRDRLTLVEASAKFGIPKSSIHERIRKIPDKEIQEQLDELFYQAKRYR